MNLHGNWRPVRAELDGQEAPTMALERMEFVLSEAEYLVRFAGEIHDRGLWCRTESTLTLTSQHEANDGRQIPAIYQLAGERLRICYGLDGNEPAEFKTSASSQRYLVTYRRLPVG
jgi:uncharacterized protein (TIGR03067 family)